MCIQNTKINLIRFYFWNHKFQIKHIQFSFANQIKFLWLRFPVICAQTLRKIAQLRLTHKAWEKKHTVITQYIVEYIKYMYCYVWITIHQSIQIKSNQMKTKWTLLIFMCLSFFYVYVCVCVAWMTHYKKSKKKV